MTGVVYLSYAVIALIGQALASFQPGSGLATAVQVGGTLWYAIVSLLLCRLFGDPTRGAGALAMVSAVIGCVLQSLYYALGLSREAEIAALVFFGLFLAFLGYLVIRSALIPRAIGIWLLAAGLSWLALLTPAPAAVLAPVILLAGSSELALMTWLLVRGTRERGTGPLGRPRVPFRSADNTY